MDLWDVAKLLWRRWWVSLPLVLLTIAAAAYVSATMKPDYKSIGHMTLLPPTETRPEQPNAATRLSPWTVWSLSDALMIFAGRADVRSEFGAAGLSEEWTVEVTGTTLPILQLEVVAPDAQLANATLDRLVDVLTAQLAALQEPYGATGPEAITAKALDIGQNGEVVTSKVKRAALVVAAVGLVLSAAVTFLVDALLRRRRNRSLRADVDDAGPPLATRRPATVAPTPAAPVTPAAPALTASAAPASAAPASAAPASTAPASTGPVPTAPAPALAPADGEASPLASTVVVPESEDSTIVLPLSGLRSRGLRRTWSGTSGSGQG